MIGTPASSLPYDDATHFRAKSGASWGAILAGAVVAVSLSLVLLTLGAGLGFASVSPWAGHGLSATGFTVAGTIWLIVTQWLSAAAGGYVAGRLRQRWLATHVHEVFFRDTAHGLVTWGVATLFVAAVLASSLTGLVSGGARAAGGIASAGGQAMASMGPAMGHTDGPGDRGPMGVEAGGPGGAYNLDKLLRTNSAATPDSGAPGRKGPDVRGEVMHIAANAATTGSVSDEDRTYLANLIAANTGISADEAQKRVDAYIQSVNDATAKAKAAADAARKAAAQAALYTALALLVGAFIASVSAAIGGRLRDEHL
jgi:hypothetical protein